VPDPVRVATQSGYTDAQGGPGAARLWRALPSGPVGAPGEADCWGTDGARSRGVDGTWSIQTPFACKDASSRIRFDLTPGPSARHVAPGPPSCEGSSQWRRCSPLAIRIDAALTMSHASDPGFRHAFSPRKSVRHHDRQKAVRPQAPHRRHLHADAWPGRTRPPRLAYEARHVKRRRPPLQPLPLAAAGAYS